MREPWMADAACSGLTPMFFPERGDTVTIEAALSGLRRLPRLVTVPRLRTERRLAP